MYQYDATRLVYVYVQSIQYYREYREYRVQSIEQSMMEYILVEHTPSRTPLHTYVYVEQKEQRVLSHVIIGPHRSTRLDSTRQDDPCGRVGDVDSAHSTWREWQSAIGQRGSIEVGIQHEEGGEYIGCCLYSLSRGALLWLLICSILWLYICARSYVCTLIP